MRCKLLLEAATGLAYLHSTEGGLEPILHLDVKRLAIITSSSWHTNKLLLYTYVPSSNILLDGAMKAKLGDFGFAMKLPKLPTGKSFIHTSLKCGTEGYIAPEFHRGELGPKIDICVCTWCGKLELKLEYYVPCQMTSHLYRSCLKFIQNRKPTVGKGKFQLWYVQFCLHLMHN